MIPKPAICFGVFSRNCLAESHPHQGHTQRLNRNQKAAHDVRPFSVSEKGQIKNCIWPYPANEGHHHYHHSRVHAHGTPVLYQK